MKLRKLSISGLFDHFNHVIPFNEENITIITAPNGYGKTIALKVIDAIFNKKFGFLASLQFNSIELVTSEDTITIKKEISDDANFELISDANPDEKFFYSQERVKPISRGFSMSEIDSKIPFVQRVGSREWEDLRTGEIYELDYLIENFHQYFSEEGTIKNLPEWYDEICSKINVHFIQDQRLLLSMSEPSRRRRRFINTIEQYAKDLAFKIKEAGLDSQQISQQLDTSFPERLLNKKSEFEVLGVDRIKEELKNLQNKRKRLAKYSLLSSERYLPQINILDEIEDQDARVLTFYVRDTQEKLEAYDSLLKKIELFFSILNKKRLSLKKIEIDYECGFRFYTDKDRLLELTQLSSGEQHQIVLLYELIFQTKENVLVLIDEPEISLHVAWQKEFLKDLKEIIDLQNMPVVIATHSPQIIDDNWHLTVDLEEGVYA